MAHLSTCQMSKPVTSVIWFLQYNNKSYHEIIDNPAELRAFSSGLAMDRVPGQTGSLLLNEEGAVLASSGDLENDEKTAVIIMGLVNLTSYLDKAAFPEEGFKKLSITYDTHCYIICLSNRKVHVVKKTINGDTSSVTS